MDSVFFFSLFAFYDCLMIEPLCFFARSVEALIWLSMEAALMVNKTPGGTLFLSFSLAVSVCRDFMIMEH